MRRRYLYLILITGIVIGIGFGFESIVRAEGDPANGRSIYEKYCLLCHGPQGRGDGPQGHLMNPPAANFRSPESRRKSDEMWLKAIREGHPDTAMTGWEDFLYDEEIEDVLAYIRAISGGPEKGF